MPRVRGQVGRQVRGQVPCTVPDDFRATVVRIFAYMGGLAILAIVAASFFGNPAVVAAIEPAPRPEWITVERPHPAFDMQMPELAAAGFNYAILRRGSDGARKDVMTWGEPGGASPYVMVEIDRPGGAGEHFLDAPSEIAARIVDFTVTDDVKPAGQIDSKFGPVELVDFAIAMPGARSGPRRCLGFARPFNDPPLQIAGWYCSAGPQPVDRATLGCALDRLTMLSAGGDAKLADLFAHAELKRTFCGERNPILAATPERNVPVPVPHRVRYTHGLRARAEAR
ncbi:MAG TPA: hypothetical protein VMC05_09710 [Xanthobacteraceae bacterium]|nr:hypothetical protein [Xanthobacteraceae bacterium]